MSFLYLEHCVVGRDSNAVTATDERGIVHIPSASLGVLLLGPGTNLTHQAMVLLADSGAAVVWVGEHGVRCYASGRSLARSSRLVEAQAKLVSNRQTRLAVARAMYDMRFESDDDTSSLTMQQLRGREGARVRAIYRDASREHSVQWSGREYSPTDFAASDTINQALSAAHACLYGVVHAVIVALGCSPGLGFVHTGHELSFVYDIADLYKAEITIPIAFRCVGEFEGAWSSADPSAPPDDPIDDLASYTRRRVRDAISDGHILTRCAHDIRRLLLPDEPTTGEEKDAVVLTLWDDKVGRVAAGANYSPDDLDEVDW
ncbi:type I-E CRISPR-associated endonuclease Cas1e [Brooklawnia cerclae]|uniref:CRISPR-associated endonuclease Cas1 n=1 Tax=Brooklawnia cerclae TaxID=349934 RepID=A0ABX0SLQ5_9ACTN|nr:CRISPR-associated protein Cas1 [Brooklawnia cerclae]